MFNKVSSVQFKQGNGNAPCVSDDRDATRWKHGNVTPINWYVMTNITYKAEHKQETGQNIN